MLTMISKRNSFPNMLDAVTFKYNQICLAPFPGRTLNTDEASTPHLCS